MQRKITPARTGQYCMGQLVKTMGFSVHPSASETPDVRPPRHSPESRTTSYRSAKANKTTYKQRFFCLPGSFDRTKSEQNPVSYREVRDTSSSREACSCVSLVCPHCPFFPSRSHPRRPP